MLPTIGDVLASIPEPYIDIIGYLVIVPLIIYALYIFFLIFLDMGARNAFKKASSALAGLFGIKIFQQETHYKAPSGWKRYTSYSGHYLLNKDRSSTISLIDPRNSIRNIHMTVVECYDFIPETEENPIVKVTYHKNLSRAHDPTVDITQAIFRNPMRKTGLPTYNHNEVYHYKGMEYERETIVMKKGKRFAVIILNGPLDNHDQNAHDLKLILDSFVWE